MTISSSVGRKACSNRGRSFQLFRVQASTTHLGDPEWNGTEPGRHPLAPVYVPVAFPVRCPLVPFRLQDLFRLRFEGMLDEVLAHRLKAGQVALQQGLDNFVVKIPYSVKPRKEKLSGRLSFRKQEVRGRGRRASGSSGWPR